MPPREPTGRPPRFCKDACRKAEHRAPRRRPIHTFHAIDGRTFEFEPVPLTDLEPATTADLEAAQADDLEPASRADLELVVISNPGPPDAG